MTEKDMITAQRIASLVSAAGGKTYFVGGYVRDLLLGKESKDIDVEVHGIEPRKLEEILDAVGERAEFGKSFGVYSIKGTSLDVAMPRKESATGRGHRDFDISVDPFIGTYKASERRDFTIGALMQDVLTGEITDHFGGAQDLKNGVIRHVCTRSFPEDPLRVLRAAQFAARFGFEIAPETLELCRGMDISYLPRERIFEELKKALLQAERPSIFFEALRKMNKLKPYFAEAEALIGIPQNPKHHAEGDVWVHTMMVINEAAKRREKAASPMGFMLSALTHDFGKAVCTEIVDGEIHAYGHETAGLPIIKEFMERLTEEKELTAYVLNMAELHMKPNTAAAGNASVKSTNKLFDISKDPLGLIMLGMSDAYGKIAPRPFYDTEPFLMERLGIYREYMERPFVSGRDLIDAGLAPDKDFSEILAYAHKLRLAGIEKESALRQTVAYGTKLRRKNRK